MSNLSRRSLLASVPCAGMVAALPSVSFAMAPALKNQRLIVFILRGALDGLSAVPPIGDVDYAGLRGALTIPGASQPNGAVALGSGFFGLHPALATWAPLYQSGELLIAHAMASPYRDRSHFDGQAVLENGTNSSTGASSGWLNRLMSVLGARHWAGKAVAFTPTIPLVLQGAAPVDNWYPDSNAGATSAMVSLASGMYAADPPLSAALALSQQVNQLAAAKGGDAVPARTLADLCATASVMLAADAGPNVATFEAYGWDTHIRQGAATGPLANNLAGLAASVLALRQGMGPRWGQALVFVLTEFGRTAVPNGTGGTDHGTAGAGFVLGGAVAGGRVLANWPGLSNGALYQGRDLAPTLDMRSLLKGALGDYFALSSASLATVFPDSSAAPPLANLIRG